MGIFKPLRKLMEQGQAHTGEYVDLSEMPIEEDVRATQTMVRVAEIFREEDLGTLTSLLYEGSIVLVDYTPVANDELTLKRITGELKSVARDTGGDVAALGRNFLVATPAGVKIDRTKLRQVY